MTGTRDDDRSDYQASFRRQVFQLLEWGYDRLDVLSFRNSLEEDLTGEIVNQVKVVLQDRSLPKWVGRFTIHEEPPLDALGRKGKRRKRLDIEMERVCHGPRPKYPFEAKRLCQGTHATMREYLGPKGLGEFLSGNYAADVDEAGMLGYVQSNTPSEWAKKAENIFQNDPGLVKACANGEWTKSKGLAFLNHWFRSEHYRISVGRPILIYHLFLLFC